MTKKNSTTAYSRNLCIAAAMVAMAGCSRSHNADVVATVNGHAIMRAEMEKAYKDQLGENQQQPSQEQADSLRLNLLRELIDEEIVQQRAAKMNLTATNEEVDAKLAEMKAPYTEEQFNDRLRSSNHTLDDVKHDLRAPSPSTNCLTRRSTPRSPSPTVT